MPVTHDCGTSRKISLTLGQVRGVSALSDPPQLSNKGRALGDRLARKAGQLFTRKKPEQFCIRKLGEERFSAGRCIGGKSTSRPRDGAHDVRTFDRFEKEHFVATQDATMNGFVQLRCERVDVRAKNHFDITVTRQRSGDLHERWADGITPVR